MGLVQPVGGDAVVGHRFHFLGADLNLQRNAGVRLQRGVQRLIAVGLGNRHVILEAAGNRNEVIVHRAQHPVAGVHPVDDDAEAEHVHDVRERLMLFLHLLVDAVQMLFPAQHPGLDALFLEAALQAGLDRGENLTAVAARRLHRLADQPRAHRVDVVEGEVLVLHTHVVHAQPERDRCVDFQGFRGDALALLGAHHMQGAHVVQTVGQLHQDHADVAGHGQHHLAQILGLLLRFRFELDLGDLGDPVHQLGDFLAERLGELLLGDAGVLDHVVQHGRHQRGVVHVHVHQDVRHRQRMRDIGVPASPVLALVGFLGKIVGANHLRNLLFRQVAA